MVMVHGDDKGLVIPPRVAQIQVVIVPTGLNATTSDEERERIFDECVKLEKELKKAGIRVKADVREHHTPAFKWNEWELKVCRFSSSPSHILCVCVLIDD